MTLIEFIGFVISLAAMIFLAAKSFWENVQRRRYPEKYAERQQQQEKLFADLKRSLNIENEEEENDEDIEEEIAVKQRPVTVPPPVPKKATILREHLQHPPKKGSINDSYREEIVSSRFLKEEAGAYDLNKQRNPPSRAAKTLKRLPSLKNMLIIKEVFGPPKSMRINPWEE